MSFTTTILQWFGQNGRELPWRETRDPYAIWLSEVILQQTRIEQGRPYWERFMRRWPTVADLAAASEDEVLREWQGLGYYSRARNLLATARQVSARGGFPSTFQELRALKGVGDYTAAAIGSFAFNLPVAVVDGNVYRVLARHFGISTPINTTLGKKEFTALAQQLLLPALNREGQGAGLFNQAMMDFGATLCMPSSPHCDECPLMETCVALREGRVGELPVKQRRVQVKEVNITYIYIRYAGETVLRRRPAGGIWAGLYEPFLIENWEFGIENSQFSILNSQLLAKQVKHVLTHRVIYADFYLWEPQERPQLPEGYFWIREEDIGNYGVSRLVEMLFSILN